MHHSGRISRTAPDLKYDPPLTPKAVLSWICSLGSLYPSVLHGAKIMAHTPHLQGERNPAQSSNTELQDPYPGGQGIYIPESNQLLVIQTETLHFWACQWQSPNPSQALGWEAAGPAVSCCAQGVQTHFNIGWS